MESESTAPVERISSASTGLWRDFFPHIWTVGVGFGMLGIWFEWFGRPTPPELKLLLALLWAVTSILFKLGTRNLREVWLMDQEMVVAMDGQRVRVPLEEVTEIKETRGQKVKIIRLLLRGESRVGSEIRFIPVQRAQLPFTDHPIVREIRDRKRQIAGGRHPPLDPE